MPEISVACSMCASTTVLDGVVGRSARCERCGADLRCCRNCRFYDRSAYNECSEPSAERVVDKDRANFCDYFSPPAPGSRLSPGEAEQAAPLSSLESLFRKN